MNSHWLTDTISKRRRYRLSLFILTILLSGCSHLFFYPQKQWVRTPAELGLAYRDIAIATADDIQLHAWLITPPSTQQSRGIVLFLHGNAENISTHIGSVFWLPEAGYSVLLLDYRGYGRSQGVADMPGALWDVRAAIEWLQQHNPEQQPLFLFGQSIGAHLGGLTMASSPQLKAGFNGVVLDSGFTSFRQISRDVTARSWLTWPLQYPISWSMPASYDLTAVINNLSPLPVMLMHSVDDPVIPWRHSQRLFEATRSPKSLLSYRGGHITSMQQPTMRQALIDFLARHSKGR